MKSKGKGRIIAGIILIAFQILGMLGNLRGSGELVPQLDGGAGYSGGFLVGYFSFGIIGVILLIFGILAKKNQN